MLLHYLGFLSWILPKQTSRQHDEVRNCTQRPCGFPTFSWNQGHRIDDGLGGDRNRLNHLKHIIVAARYRRFS